MSQPSLPQGTRRPTFKKSNVVRKFLINSSAKFNTTGEQRIYPVTHIQELMDIDLTRIPYNARRVPCGRLGYDMV